MDKKVACFWHADTFDKYIQEGINPLGLCIQIFPMLEDVDPSFKSKWENNLQLCTQTMMVLLSEEYKKRITNLDKTIDSIYAKLLPFRDTPIFKEYEDKIKTRLNQKSQERLTTRDKKLWRDKRAFQEGTAYKWHQTSVITRPHRGNINRTPRDSKSNSSLNSSVSSSSYNRQRHRKPRKNKRSPSGDDPTYTKKRITDTTSTSSTTNLLPLGKGNSQGVNQLPSAGPIGVGSSVSTSTGDTSLSSITTTLLRSDQDFLAH